MTLQWLLRKVGFAAVALLFNSIIIVLAAVSGATRLIFGAPDALRKVEAARAAQASAGASCGAGDGAAAGVERAESARSQQGVDECASDQQMLVFNEPDKGHASYAWQLVGPYMRQHGRGALSNSQLFNPEFIHFFVPGVGSLPFIQVDMYNRVVTMAIGDPLCAPEQWAGLTRAFVAQFPSAYFYYASEAYAAVLEVLGYWVNDVGAETTLQVQRWTYTARTRTLRAAARSAREAGVRVRELQPEDLTPELRHRLQHEVSGSWLQQKAVADRELSVCIRSLNFDIFQLQDGIRLFVAEAYADPALAPAPVVDQALQGAALHAKPPKPPRRRGANRHSVKAVVSLAAADKRGGDRGSSAGPVDALVRVTDPREEKQQWQRGGQQQTQKQQQQQQQQQQREQQEQKQEEQRPQQQPELLGFVLLDPLWEGGQVQGHVTSLVRMKQEAHAGTLKLLYEDVISRLRCEGKQHLTFGLAPSFNIRDARFSRHIRWLRWSNMFLFHCCNHIYAFQNLAFSKARYGGGLNDARDGFRDAAASMTHCYVANRSAVPGWNLIDLHVTVIYIGIFSGLWSLW